MVPPVTVSPKYVLVEDNLDGQFEINRLYSSYQRHYQDGDFVYPLFQLMIRARLKERLNSDEKRRWVLLMHQGMVKTTAYLQNFQKRAIHTGPFLIDLFLNVSNRNSLHARNKTVYDRLIHFKKDFSLDADHFVKEVTKALGNGIEVIEAVSEAQFRYFRTQTPKDLCYQAFQKADWSDEEKTFYEKICLFVLTQMQEAKQHFVTFDETIKQDNPPCYCIIF